MRDFERDDMALSHLMFAPNEVFRFARSREYAVIEDTRGGFEVARAKLCASRTLWLIAYLLAHSILEPKVHEILFEAHTGNLDDAGGLNGGRQDSNRTDKYLFQL